MLSSPGRLSMPRWLLVCAVAYRCSSVTPCCCCCCRLSFLCFDSCFAWKSVYSTRAVCTIKTTNNASNTFSTQWRRTTTSVRMMAPMRRVQGERREAKSKFCGSLASVVDADAAAALPRRCREDPSVCVLLPLIVAFPCSSIISLRLLCVFAVELLPDICEPSLTRCVGGGSGSVRQLLE